MKPGSVLVPTLLLSESKTPSTNRARQVNIMEALPYGGMATTNGNRNIRALPCPVIVRPDQRLSVESSWAGHLARCSGRLQLYLNRRIWAVQAKGIGHPPFFEAAALFKPSCKLQIPLDLLADLRDESSCERANRSPARTTRKGPIPCQRLPSIERTTSRRTPNSRRVRTPPNRSLARRSWRS